MREVARKKTEHVPTPERVVRMIAQRIALKAGETYSIMDPCARDGRAVELLRSELLAKCPEAKVVLYGIEADRSLARQANEKFVATGGQCVKGSIENTHPSKPASILFFNPPSDLIKGSGRMERLMYDRVEKWAIINGGVAVIIVPSAVLASDDTPYCGLDAALYKRFERIGLWAFPAPEHDTFKRCVFIGCSRPRAIMCNAELPWSRRAWNWPKMTEADTPLVGAKPADVRRIDRKQLDDDDLRLLLDSSHISRALILLSQTAPPAPERPPNPLKSGHMALALGGGLSDGLIEQGDDVFLLRGTHKMCWVKADDRYDQDHDKTTQTFRTRHELLVRCLLPNGNIEEYSSEPKQGSEEDET